MSVADWPDGQGRTPIGSEPPSFTQIITGTVCTTTGVDTIVGLVVGEGW
jgi:hypothetical protein